LISEVDIMTSSNKYLPIGELLNLSGKIALVTGGARGIGFAIAYRLAEAGAAITIVDLNREKGSQAASDLCAYGYSATFLPCDVSHEEEVIQTVKAATSSMHGLHILVNNAGIFPSTPLLQMTSFDMDRVLAVNVKGVFYMIREAARYMIEQNTSGSIINLASIDSVHPSHTGMSLYDASKGAVLTMTRSLAKELGPAGIRVNAVAPGGIMTEGALSQKGEQFNRAGLKEFMSRIPLGSMGKADDIGRVALFLASDLSGYITGSLITADGGYLLS
jgi:2-dehydro-3-deoxy-D-gluconate 5-dehydrogenase